MKRDKISRVLELIIIKNVTLGVVFVVEFKFIGT